MCLCKLIIFGWLLTVSNSLRHRIIGSQVASNGEFPYLVSLQLIHPKGFMGEHICGGVIIHEYWILSASHCVESLNILKDFALLIVVAGKYDVGKREPTEQRILIESCYQHELYDNSSNYGTNDISLVKLSVPLTWTQWIKPIDLPEIGSEPTGNATFCGWGAIEHINGFLFHKPSLLHFKVLPIIDRNECNEAVEAVAREDNNEMKNSIHETDICTGPLTGGYSMCIGDSGSPLVSTNEDGKLVLVGISSWAMVPCGRKGAPSVYARVSSYIDWIHNIMFRF